MTVEDLIRHLLQLIEKNPDAKDYTLAMMAYARGDFHAFGVPTIEAHAKRVYWRLHK